MDTRVTFEDDDPSREFPISPGLKNADRQGTLSRAQFDAQLREARQSLWCIAAAILSRPDQAEDVVQDAVVTALAKIDQFDPGTSFTAWMGQIVRYTALNARRKDVSAHIAPGADPNLAEARVSSVEGQAVDSHGLVMSDQESFDDEVMSALAKINETQRACLLLRTVHALSYKEIAQTLSIPEGTAMSHVHRARTALRKSLTPDLQENKT